jgi:hypothetical protein
MLLIREVMYCKPGQARPMVKKFLALNKLGKKFGFGAMRVMTDVSGERFWTVVAETEVESLDKHAEMMHKAMENKEAQEIMKDYHDLVDHGRREIYTLEK